MQILFPTEYGYKKSGRLTEGVAFFQKFDWQKPQPSDAFVKKLES